MPLQPIDVPETIPQQPLSERAEQLIDQANTRIEAFLLAERRTFENFVTCDFDLFDQSLQWLRANHLLAGNRFCEWGSGFGVVTMLAALQGMESIGIEIESALVDQAADLAADLDVPANFFCGSFVPRDLTGILDWAAEIEHVATNEGDVFDEIGLAIDDFDLFFAFPWPGEQGFFEAVFEAAAADGALLLTYRGREGMNLVRKV